MDDRFARAENGYTVYYLTDAVGSVMRLTDPTGAIITTYTYGPYGQTVQSGQANDNPYQFAGREIETNPWFYYFRGRYLDTVELNRFESRDPSGLRKSYSKLYSFINNSPPNGIDPSGAMTFSVVVGFNGFDWEPGGGADALAAYAAANGGDIGTIVSTLNEGGSIGSGSIALASAPIGAETAGVYTDMWGTAVGCAVTNISQYSTLGFATELGWDIGLGGDYSMRGAMGAALAVGLSYAVVGALSGEGVATVAREGFLAGSIDPVVGNIIGTAVGLGIGLYVSSGPSAPTAAP